MAFGNSIFRGESPSWANACVGDNGAPGYLEYAKGFSSAANLLIESVLLDEGINLYVDEFVYPICFNMRHSLELRLKGLVEAVHEILDIKSVRHAFNLNASHDIGQLWGYLKDIFEKADARFGLMAAKLDFFIQNFADVDPTGQTFRYPTSNQSKKHLVDVATINIAVLKVYFTRAEKNLDKLDRFTKEIRSEYSRGTFTKSLSRKMLFEIASMLPEKSFWGSDELAKAKLAIKARYAIGSKELTQALKIIKSNYQMAEKIKCSPELLGLGAEELHGFFDLWMIHHDAERIDKLYKNGSQDHDMSDIDSMLLEIKNGIRSLNKSWSIFQQRYSVENLAGITALFYFARDKRYVEDYSEQYRVALAELSLHGGTDGLRNAYSHIVNKVNAVENICLSLYVLGYSALAKEVIERFKFAGGFIWLEDANSGKLFDEPWKAIYKV